VDHTTEGDVGAGFLGSLTATYLPLFESERRPFLLTTLTAGYARTSAVSDDNMRYRWSAGDLRLGVMLGKTFFDRLIPFATARLFGGPVSWKLGGEDVVGSDIYHYTVGLGTTYRIPGKLDIFVEALGLGEQSARIGGTFSF
jgi:hypothetical protein